MGAEESVPTTQNMSPLAIRILDAIHPTLKKELGGGAIRRSRDHFSYYTGDPNKSASIEIEIIHLTSGTNLSWKQRVRLSVIEVSSTKVIRTEERPYNGAETDKWILDECLKLKGAHISNQTGFLMIPPPAVNYSKPAAASDPAQFPKPSAPPKEEKKKERPKLSKQEKMLIKIADLDEDVFKALRDSPELKGLFIFPDFQKFKLQTPNYGVFKKFEVWHHTQTWKFVIWQDIDFVWLEIWNAKGKRIEAPRWNEYIRIVNPMVFGYQTSDDRITMLGKKDDNYGKRFSFKNMFDRKLGTEEDQINESEKSSKKYGSHFDREETRKIIHEWRTEAINFMRFVAAFKLNEKGQWEMISSEGAVMFKSDFKFPEDDERGKEPVDLTPAANTDKKSRGRSRSRRRQKRNNNK